MQGSKMPGLSQAGRDWNDKSGQKKSGYFLKMTV